MKRRHRRRKSATVDLNLAAMLDMAFQLLTFFILTFRPAPVEGQLGLHLPPPVATAKPQHISALTIFEGQVTAVTKAGRSSVNVAISCSGSVIVARITRQSCAGLGIVPGKPVFAIVKAVSVSGPGHAPR